MSYKLSNNFDGIIKIDEEGIIIFVPNCEDNKDWHSYQEWLALDNEPEPAE